ncbi:MAG: hypothetical protein IPN77_15355 [Sandaracinaceae bacterium]|nr:hypothetical protein [Sandaracinaceae bacterium]
MQQGPGPLGVVVQRLGVLSGERSAARASGHGHDTERLLFGPIRVLRANGRVEVTEYPAWSPIVEALRCGAHFVYQLDDSSLAVSDSFTGPLRLLLPAQGSVTGLAGTTDQHAILHDVSEQRIRAVRCTDGEVTEVPAPHDAPISDVVWATGHGILVRAVGGRLFRVGAASPVALAPFSTPNGLATDLRGYQGSATLRHYDEREVSVGQRPTETDTTLPSLASLLWNERPSWLLSGRRGALQAHVPLGNDAILDVHLGHVVHHGGRTDELIRPEDCDYGSDGARYDGGAAVICRHGAYFVDPAARVSVLEAGRETRFDPIGPWRLDELGGGARLTHRVTNEQRALVLASGYQLFAVRGSHVLASSSHPDYEAVWHWIDERSDVSPLRSGDDALDLHGVSDDGVAYGQLMRAGEWLQEHTTSQPRFAYSTRPGELVGVSLPRGANRFGVINAQLAIAVEVGDTLRVWASSDFGGVWAPVAVPAGAPRVRSVLDCYGDGCRIGALFVGRLPRWETPATSIPLVPSYPRYPAQEELAAWSCVGDLAQDDWRLVVAHADQETMRSVGNYLRVSPNTRMNVSLRDDRLSLAFTAQELAGTVSWSTGSGFSLQQETREYLEPIAVTADTAVIKWCVRATDYEPFSCTLWTARPGARPAQLEWPPHLMPLTAALRGPDVHVLGLNRAPQLVEHHVFTRGQHTLRRVFGHREATGLALVDGGIRVQAASPHHGRSIFVEGADDLFTRIELPATVVACERGANGPVHYIAWPRSEFSHVWLRATPAGVCLEAARTNGVVVRGDGAGGLAGTAMIDSAPVACRLLAAGRDDP